MTAASKAGHGDEGSKLQQAKFAWQFEETVDELQRTRNKSRKPRKV